MPTVRLPPKLSKKLVALMRSLKKPLPKPMKPVMP